MSKEMAAPRQNHSPSIHFHVDTESKVKIDLTGLEIGEKITLVLTGTIDSLSRDKWGQSIGLKVSSAKLGGEERSESEKSKFSSLLVKKRM